MCFHRWIISKYSTYITTVSQSGIKMKQSRKMLIDRLESEDEHEEEENYKTGK
jgi:hypothetical protein